MKQTKCEKFFTVKKHLLCLCGLILGIRLYGRVYMRQGTGEVITGYVPTTCQELDFPNHHGNLRRDSIFTTLMIYGQTQALEGKITYPSSQLRHRKMSQSPPGPCKSRAFG